MSIVITSQRTVITQILRDGVAEITRDVQFIPIFERPEQGLRGLIGNTEALINDTSLSLSTAYSGKKYETMLSDKVARINANLGDVADTNLVVNFLNAISQGSV